MFIIINPDKSVNWVGDQAPPDKYVLDNMSVIEITEDQIDRPEGDTSNLHEYFWEEETQKLVLDPVKFLGEDAANLGVIAKEDLQALIDQQIALNAAITSAQSEVYNKLVVALAQKFIDDPVIAEILSDQIITVDEFATIAEMLSGNTVTANT